MKNILALAFTTVLATLTVQAQAKPVTVKMQHCGGNSVRTISTDCKNQTTNFTIGYELKNQGQNNLVLTIHNPKSRDIFIDWVDLYSRNKQCEIDSWGPDGQTIDAKNHFYALFYQCKPENISKFVFHVGNKRYTYTK